jgi:hypothetical protein
LTTDPFISNSAKVEGISFGYARVIIELVNFRNMRQKAFGDDHLYHDDGRARLLVGLRCTI